MRKLVLFLTLLVSLTSCEYFISPGIQVEPKLYMVAIGVGYERHGTINELKFTKNDLEDLTGQIRNLVDGKMEYEILRFSDCSDNEDEAFVLKRETSQHNGIETLKYGKEDFCNPYAFFDTLAEAFTTMPEKDDIIIFYYAGHGDEETGNLVYYYDSLSKDYQTISQRELFDSFLSRWQARRLVILDSCFSGNFIEEGDLASTLFYSGKDSELTFNLSSSLSSSFASLSLGNKAKPDVFVISGSGYVQSTYENVAGIEHGIFTYALLKYLDYDEEMDEASFTTKFEGRTISVKDLYDGLIKNFPFKEFYRISTPNTTPSKLDLTVFDFR